jgi:hypothetical protein
MTTNLAQLLGSVANSNAEAFTATISRTVKWAADICSQRFAARRAEIARWATVIDPGPSSLFLGEFDQHPPLITPENSTLPDMVLEASSLSGKAGVLGLVWNPWLQSLTQMNAGGVSEALGLAGDHLFDGVEEGLVEALTTPSYVAGQREASALTATSLASAMAKSAALRTASGARGPLCKNLLLAPELVVTYANIFPYGVPGLTVSTSKFLAAGKWFLLPDVSRSPLRIGVARDVAFDDLGFSTDASAKYIVRLFTFVSESVTVRLAADGSVRWVISGGT